MSNHEYDTIDTGALDTAIYHGKLMLKFTIEAEMQNDHTNLNEAKRYIEQAIKLLCGERELQKTYLEITKKMVIDTIYPNEDKKEDLKNDQNN